MGGGIVFWISLRLMPTAVGELSVRGAQKLSRCLAWPRHTADHAISMQLALRGVVLCPAARTVSHRRRYLVFERSATNQRVQRTRILCAADVFSIHRVCVSSLGFSRRVADPHVLRSSQPAFEACHIFGDCRVSGAHFRCAQFSPFLRFVGDFEA